MATFHLTIKTGNDAMQTGADLAEALRDVAKRIDDDVPATAGTLGAIKDENGNQVGRFETDDWTEDG